MICNLFSPDHEGLHLGTLCLCSCGRGCGDSLRVHCSGGFEGEPGAHQGSPCREPIRHTWGEHMDI